MCVLYVSFWSKVRPRTSGCVAMCSAVLFILKSRLFLCSSSSFVSSNRILPFVYTFSGIFVELLKVIQSAGMC